jgi:hypothetical protein
MRSTRAILWWLLLIVSINISNLASAETQKLQPRITIESPSFHFSEVKEGTPVEHVFRIANSGDGELKIKKIKTS